MLQFCTQFPTGSKVIIDDDQSIKMVVLGNLFKDNGVHHVLCEWFSNGIVYERYFEVWRVKHAD